MNYKKSIFGSSIAFIVATSCCWLPALIIAIGGGSTLIGISNGLENLIKIGWGLLILSLIIVWIAQSQMANSWRIGIDEKNKTKLVTSGMFSLSRNPIFLGIMIANVGLFLVIPNAFTLLIVSLSTISINTQIRLEEEFLRKEFGTEYAEYLKEIRRWI